MCVDCGIHSLHEHIYTHVMCIPHGVMLLWHRDEYASVWFLVFQAACDRSQRRERENALLGEQFASRIYNDLYMYIVYRANKQLSETQVEN